MYSISLFLPFSCRRQNYLFKPIIKAATKKREREAPGERDPRDVPCTITYPISNIIFLLAIKSNQRRRCLAARRVSRPFIVALLSRDFARETSGTRTIRKRRKTRWEREKEGGGWQRNGCCLGKAEGSKGGIKLTGSTALSHLFRGPRIMRFPRPSLMLCCGCSQPTSNPRRQGRHELALPFVFCAVLPIISK